MKVLIAAAMAMAVLASVGMAETAMAQTTEIKIGVLGASPPEFEVGPNQAMVIAEKAWNRESAHILGYELKLDFINIRGDFQDPAHQAFVAQTIGAAVQDGYKHFIAPSDDFALAVVHGIVSQFYPNSILISPASQSTFPSTLSDDDNLFRLVPNIATQGEHLIEQFDLQGVDRAVIVTDAAFKPLVDQGLFPDDVHDHYVLPSFAIYGPGDTRNVPSLTALNDRLVELIDQHGSDRLAVFAATQPPSFVTMAHVLAANPQLDAIDDVRWFGYNYLGHSLFITGDRTAAAFADAVDMNVIIYEIAINDVNAPLAELPSISPGFRNFNFASYDAVHLLADVIAIGGVDNPNLKDVVFEVVNDNFDPVEHTDRILGEGAIGDYSLDRMSSRRA